MPLPRPASPRVLWADIKAIFGQRSPHRMVAATAALVMPLAILVIFYFDARTNIMPGPQVIYVESWPADRSDEQIIAKQKADQAEREALLEERRRQFQRLDERLKKVGI